MTPPLMNLNCYFFSNSVAELNYASIPRTSSDDGGRRMRLARLAFPLKPKPRPFGQSNAPLQLDTPPCLPISIATIADVKHFL